MDRGGGPVQTFLRYFVIISIGLAIFQDVRGVIAAPQPVDQSQEPANHHSNIPRKDFNKPRDNEINTPKEPVHEEPQRSYNSRQNDDYI